MAFMQIVVSWRDSWSSTYHVKWHVTIIRCSYVSPAGGSFFRSEKSYISHDCEEYCRELKPEVERDERGTKLQVLCLYGCAALL